MNLYLILRQHGFIAPFRADDSFRGGVRDAAGKMAPTVVLPDQLGAGARHLAAELIADLLNAQAQQFERREEAA
jgi:hypothetical protein